MFLLVMKQGKKPSRSEYWCCVWYWRSDQFLSKCSPDLLFLSRSEHFISIKQKGKIIFHLFNYLTHFCDGADTLFPVVPGLGLSDVFCYTSLYSSPEIKHEESVSTKRLWLITGDHTVEEGQCTSISHYSSRYSPGGQTDTQIQIISRQALQSPTLCHHYLQHISTDIFHRQISHLQSRGWWREVRTFQHK